LCGLAILIAGAITYANIDEVNHALDGINVSASPVALIVIGSIVFFAVFLLVILIAEIAIGIVAFVNRDGWDDAIQKNVKDMFDRYDSTTNSTKNEVDAIQKSLECCGIDGSTFWLGHLGGLPRSCCIKPDGVCDFSVIKDSSVVFQSGCKSKIIELLQGIDHGSHICPLLSEFHQEQRKESCLNYGIIFVSITRKKKRKKIKIKITTNNIDCTQNLQIMND
ncbi:hypothetical protein C0J52_27330, partial [Blattella germanica]